MDIFINELHKCIIPLICILVVFLIDFITGIIKAYFIEHKITSNKLRSSVPKFLGYISMVIVSMILDLIILTSTDLSTSPISLIVCIWLIIVEIISIIENLKTIGIKVPKVITNVINLFKSNYEINENEDSTK